MLTLMALYSEDNFCSRHLQRERLNALSSIYHLGNQSDPPLALIYPVIDDVSLDVSQQPRGSGAGRGGLEAAVRPVCGTLQ